MAGKITTILAKKEAEAYYSQGLHQEALLLYQNLLATSPSMDGSLKEAVLHRMDEINTALQTGPMETEEFQRLSAADIMRVREGWGEKATEEDILVCAQAFAQIGHHQYALAELSSLLKKGVLSNAVAELLADCLVHLHSAREFVYSVRSFANQVYSRTEIRYKLYLMIAAEMVRPEQLQYAQALYEYLHGIPVVEQKVPRRLAAIAETIRQLKILQGRNDREKAPEPPSVPASKCRKKFSFGWPAFLKFRRKRPKTAESS